MARSWGTILLVGPPFHSLKKGTSAIRKPRMAPTHHRRTTASAGERGEPTPCWRQKVPQSKNVKLKKDLPPVPAAGRIHERPAGTGGGRTSPTPNLARRTPGTAMSGLAG